MYFIAETVFELNKSSSGKNKFVRKPKKDTKIAPQF